MCESEEIEFGFSEEVVRGDGGEDEAGVGGSHTIEDVHGEFLDDRVMNASRSSPGWRSVRAFGRNVKVVGLNVVGV